MKRETNQALREAWESFLESQGLEDSEMTLSERLLFAVAFGAGRKAERQKNEVPIPIPTAARKHH